MVDQLLLAKGALDRGALVYLRTAQPIGVALVLPEDVLPFRRPGRL